MDVDLMGRRIDIFLILIKFDKMPCINLSICSAFNSVIELSFSPSIINSGLCHSLLIWWWKEAQIILICICLIHSNLGSTVILLIGHVHFWGEFNIFSDKVLIFYLWIISDFYILSIFALGHVFCLKLNLFGNSRKYQISSLLI